MSSPHTDPTHRHTEKWLEKSLVAPSPSLIYERSDGEKAASEKLIYEKAKTERWNRQISRAFFTIRLLIATVPVSFLAGVGMGVWMGNE
jgi:hypothetical protein